MPVDHVFDPVKVAQGRVDTSRHLIERWTHRLEHGDKSPSPEILGKWIADEKKALESREATLRDALKGAKRQDDQESSGDSG